MALFDVVEGARVLSAEDRETLRMVLDIWREHPPGTLTGEEEGERLLLAKGLIARIPPKIDPKLIPHNPPVNIEGPPLSEQIIKERR